MAFYSARNTKITINGLGVLVSNASLSSSSSIVTRYDVSSSISQNYVPENAQKNSLSLSYYLTTGEDPLKECIGNDSSTIGTNFGGLYLNSGYLSKYSFSVSSNQPVQVNATLDFYEDIKGSFSPKSATIPDSTVLTYKNLIFSETGILGPTNYINNLTYDYSMTVNPHYSIQEADESIVVHNVTKGERTVQVSANLNDYSVNLPVDGRQASAMINLADMSGITRHVFRVSGLVYDSSLASSPGSINQKNITMRQNNLGIPPSVTGINPSSGPVGQTVTVKGKNFFNIDNVYLTDQAAEFNEGTEKNLTFVVPAGALSGPITIATKGGTHISTGAFSVT